MKVQTGIKKLATEFNAVVKGVGYATCRLYQNIKRDYPLTTKVSPLVVSLLMVTSHASLMSLACTSVMLMKISAVEGHLKTAQNFIERASKKGRQYKASQASLA